MEATEHLRSYLETLAGESFYDGVSLKEPEIAEDWRFKKLKRCVQSVAKEGLNCKEDSTVRAIKHGGKCGQGPNRYIGWD